MLLQLLTILGLVVAGVATRLVGTLQFNAVGAAFLFSGATVTRKWLAVLVPLAAYFATDVILNVRGFDAQEGWHFSATSYVLFALTALLGMALRQRPTALRIGGAAALAAVVFFFVSNFTVWYGSTMYDQNPAGLLACYMAGLPFAGNMLVGNLFFSAVLFGSWHYVQHWFAESPRLAKASAN